MVDRVIGIFVVLGVISLAVLGALRSWHRPWWSAVWVRRGAFAIVAAAYLGVLFRSLGQGRVLAGFKSPSATIAGSVLAGAGGVLLMALFLTLPLAGLIRFIVRRVAGDGAFAIEPVSAPKSEAADRVASVEPLSTSEVGASERAPRSSAAEARASIGDLGVAPAPAPLVARRAVLEAAVAALPVAALGVGGAGVIGAFRPTSVVPRPMRFGELPPTLAGLRILQLTDLHLGAFMDPDGLEDLIERASAAKPDLVVVTGDLSDHLPWLPDALRRIETLAPRLGTFAVLGNHEHYRGVEEVRRAFDKSKIDLLMNEHRIVESGLERFTLLGVDDPAAAPRDKNFYERTSDLALDGAPSESFRLALCHRPSGFRALAARNVDLTLSGHTHGAQMGHGERSLLEGAMPDSFLWGRYALGTHQLYTSSGGGHWFAFRLDCPSEAPLVTLERA